MNIIHLSTSTTGGAGVTAKSIVRIQRQFGHNATLRSRDSEISRGKLIKSKISTLFSLVNATPKYAQVTHFSSNGIELESILQENPDVLFIHNWFNLLREDEIILLANRIPTVFIAHDARLATGGCHVTLGCQNFMQGCHDCPAARVKWFSTIAKKSTDSMVGAINKFVLVTPSHWLMNELNGSPISRLASARRVISNPSDVKARDILSARPPTTGAFKILYVAASLDAAYKGFDLFMDSIDLISVNQEFAIKLNIQVVGLGHNRKISIPSSKLEISFMGKLDSSEVHQLMRNADLLVVPSLSENFPGVIGEAQILGCLVAASKVGGIPEMIEDGVTGFLFEPTPEDCMKAIVRAISSTERRRIKNMASKIALTRHDEGYINAQYEAVIKELINS